MKHFGKKNTFSNLFFSKFTLVFILSLCVLVAISVYKRAVVEREIAARKEKAQAEYAELEAHRDMLLEKVNYLKADSGIESEIRKHFDVAREGEQVIIIVDEDGEDVGLTEGISPTANEKKPWYKFW